MVVLAVVVAHVVFFILFVAVSLLVAVSLIGVVSVFVVVSVSVFLLCCPCI